MGVLLLSPVVLSACSAGQVTQTASQDRDKVGALAEVGGLTLRAVELEHPRGGAYERGDDAEVRMAIVNAGSDGDSLVEVDGEGFGDAEITGAQPEDGGTGSSDAPDEIEIPAGETVFVGEDDISIELTDLDEELTTGQGVELVLTFENAGEVTVTAPVGNPEDEERRGESFDFHEEGSHSEGGEDGEG
jgi:copper(I)-binding protein